MNSFFYTLAALLLLTGLLYLTGYIGKENMSREPAAGENMAHVIGDDKNFQKECPTCMWF